MPLYPHLINAVEVVVLRMLEINQLYNIKVLTILYTSFYSYPIADLVV